MEKNIKKSDEATLSPLTNPQNKYGQADRMFASAPGKEDVSRRGEFTKHFNLGGNRRQAIVYPDAIHYRDSDQDDWKEIDNTLEEAVTAQGRRVLRNHAGRVKMEFPLEMDNGSMASISCEGNTFSWRFEEDVAPASALRRTGSELKQERLVHKAKGMAKYVGRTTESLQSANLAAELETAQEQRMDLPHLRAENRYNNVLPGVSLRYELMGDALKEDIILANREALSHAAIRLPDDFDYAVTHQQELQIMNKANGETIFTMDMPVVYDAGGNKIIASVHLTPCAGYVRMEYSIDPAFLDNAVWPVTIDPAVRYAKNRTNIQDAALYQTEAPNTAHCNMNDYPCGNRGEYEYITLVRFGELVKQKASDTIISARIGMHPTDSINVEEHMACYPMNKSWDAATATWNNMYPDTTEYISDEVISYVDTTGSTCYFNITNLYRKWYLQNQNFGVAFRYPLGVDEEHHYVQWAGARRNATNGPCVIVNYLSHAGLESWWEYESMGAGSVGTAHVDLFNGNLVFEHEDVSMSGNRMPVSISHYYNSCLANTNEQGCGLGWRISANQSLYKTTLKNIAGNDTNYYVWTDGDGTEHYFAVSGSSPYKDDETNTLKLTVSSSTATIRSKDDTAMQFPLPTDTTKKYIESITDACGNVVTYSYTNGLLTGITDGAGRVTTLVYTNGLLTQIQPPDGMNVHFEYTNNQLTKINHSNIGAANFSYTNGLLEKAYNTDGGLGGLGVEIGYQDVNMYDSSAIYGIEACKATSLMQTDSNNHGSMVCFEYLTGMTRVKALKSGNAENAVGKVLSYQFNDNGNLACVFDELGYGRRADFDAYNAETAASCMQKAVINQAKDIAFAAAATKWTAAKGNSADTIAQDTSVRCLSMPSLKMVKGGAGESSAAQTLQIPASGKYTFSAYIKTDGLTGGNAYLQISSGGSQKDSPVVQSSTQEANCGPGAEGWERVSVTINASAGNATLKLMCNASGGTVYFACPQLENGEIANRVNLLTNGDFARTETNTANSSASRLFPADWTAAAGISTDPLNCVLTSGHDMPSYLSGNALRMVSFPATENVGFNQELPVSGAKGDVYVIGGWLNSQSVYSGSEHSAPSIAYRFTGGKSDGDWQYAEFNREHVGWQFGAWAIAAPETYTGFTFSVNYARNAQTAMFTNMFMYREQFGQSFTYDDNKNLASTANLAGQKSEMKYDSLDNLISYVQPGADDADKYTLTYGSNTAEKKKHLVRTSTSPMGVKQEFSYDTYGNSTLSKTVDGTTSVLATQTEYDSAGNYPVKSYDARGNAVTRTMNANDYTLTSVTDPAGQSVSYEYDGAKRVTGVQAQAGGKTYKNAYTYENNRIKTVAHNTTNDTSCDVTYTFEYDSLGRKTNVKVGSQTLSANVYSSDRSGLLQEVQYGNGGKVKYAYDDFDRMTGVSYDSETTPRYEYVYNADGEVSKVKDTHLNRTLETERDLAYRPRQSTLKDANGNTLYRATLHYDKMNRLEKFSEKAGSANHTTGYTYDKDNRTTQITYDGDTNKVNYTYDKLGRVQKRTAVSGSNSFETAYEFVSGDTTRYGTGATTPLVKKITQPGICFEYAYDSRGNIISEKRNSLETTYAYDALGQLVRVNDPHENATWLYTYDRGGNILSKSKHPYTTGTPGAAIETIPYTYGDSNWKDKLTAYNGVAITYDEIGNPLDDGERVYTWGAGRQLQQIEMKSANTLNAVNGSSISGATVVRIVHSARQKIAAEVLRSGSNITPTTNAAHFTWYKRANSSAAWTQIASGVKEISLVQAEMDAGYQYKCSYAGVAEGFGSINVDSTTLATHTPGTADANDEFEIVNGDLKVTTSRPANANYVLENDVVKITTSATETISATASFSARSTSKVVSFKYDHNGLRTQKKVIENGVTTTYDYTLHGKLITHLTKRVAGAVEAELHFFYDAQSKPAFVEYNGTKYRYIHNLQGDIVAIVDSTGTPVVEYKYDAWGKLLGVQPQSGIGINSPFMYRGYMFDVDVGLYYLHSRYYHGDCSRFISGDSLLNNRLLNGLYTYCLNNPIIFFDSDGKDTYSVYLNVYNKEDSGLSTGHYDISIISNENDVFVFEMNEKEYKCEGLTFSYGGESGDESQGRVNVYNQGSRPDRNVTRRYLIYSDMSQAEFDEFIVWFASDFAKYNKLDGGMATYLVKDDTYKEYSIKNRIYCGPGATHMLSQVKGISDESSNRRALAFRLLKKRFENNTLVVDSNVFRWLDRWFMTPVKR